MKKNMLLVPLLCISATISLISATQHRDGCKEFGDPCVCSNTGTQGFCLPGWMSNPPDQLYCDCSSDVLTEDEVIGLMIKKFCKKDSGITKFRGKTFRDIIRSASNSQRSAKILDAMLRILGEDPTDFDVSGKNSRKLQRNTNNFMRLREELKKATRTEKVMSHFFNVFDDCDYVGKECTCSNTGRKGICSISRSDTEEAPKLRCQCE